MPHTDEVERFVTAHESVDEASFEQNLRPQRLSEYIGQDQIKENLAIFMAAAKKRGEPIEHVLLHGSPGLGKTTLAHIIAREMAVQIRVTSGPAIERIGDLAAILTNLGPHDILFIDEIHRLNKAVEETLYPAMEDYALDIIIGKGPSARTLRLDLPKFTLIGATTKVSMLTSPLRDRFGSHFKLEFYRTEDIERILRQNARVLNIKLEGAAATEIASRARATPRIANRLLKRVRDYAEVKGEGSITVDIARKALELLDIDPLGLDATDRRILRTIVEKFTGGPVGLNTLAAAIGEEMDTLEDVYEPFLMQLGFLSRTPKGRVVTELGYAHLGIAQRKKPDQASLLS